MDYVYIDSLGSLTYPKWHASIPNNTTHWSNDVYSSTDTNLAPARVAKYLVAMKSIGWKKRKGKNFRNQSSYSMYGLGYRKRYKKRRL